MSPKSHRSYTSYPSHKTYYCNSPAATSEPSLAIVWTLHNWLRFRSNDAMKPAGSSKENRVPSNDWCGNGFFEKGICYHRRTRRACTWYVTPASLTQKRNGPATTGEAANVPSSCLVHSIFPVVGWMHARRPSSVRAYNKPSK